MIKRNSSLIDVWQRTRVFVGCALVFWLCIFLVRPGLQTGEDLAFFNAWKGSWWDWFFIWSTRLGEEYLYILLTILFFFTRRRDSWWIPLVGILVTLVSALAKQYFREPRPGAYRDEVWFSEGVILVDGVEPLGGATSFPSGHTMSAFALGLFLVYLLRLRPMAAIGVFCLAGLVGVSRVYLVMHFLDDVLLGSVMGVLLAMGMALAHRYWSRSPAGGSSQS